MSKAKQRACHISTDDRTGQTANPGACRDLFTLAFRYHNEGNMEGAARIYERILALTPDNTDALYNLAIVHHSRGRLREAIAGYHSVLERSPDLGRACFSLGNAYRDLGDPKRAAEAYRRALELEPKHLDSLVNLGNLLFSRNDLEGAIDCYRRILRLDDSRAQVHYNLGLVRHHQGRLEEAAASYRRALQLHADDIDALYNLGIVLKELQQPEEALVCFHAIVDKRAPEDTDAWLSLGNTLKDLHRLEEAAVCFRRVLEIDPAHVKAAGNLGVVYHILGRLDDARDAYRRAIEGGHDTPGNRHIMNALTGTQTDGVPPEYVIDLFDGYAKRFDHSLQELLGYQVPAKLREMFDSLVTDARPFGRALDLGCGTGLAGAAFRDRVGHLGGVDLSSGMLAQAEAKKIYDELYCCDLVDFLSQIGATYDLLLAADVIIYLGKLDAFFQAVAPCTNPGGWLFCSIENCETDETIKESDFRLRQSGRFAHSRDYVIRLADAAGFRLRDCRETEIRKERDAWIRGEMLALQFSGPS